jgi:hypothetical protein
MYFIWDHNAYRLWLSVAKVVSVTVEWQRGCFPVVNEYEFTKENFRPLGFYSKERAGTVSGPPIIGDKARWKFPKIRVICSDKFSKICPNMFGPEQAFGKNVKFCSDGPSGFQNGNFVWIGHSGLKICNFNYEVLRQFIFSHPILGSRDDSSGVSMRMGC